MNATTRLLDNAAKLEALCTEVEAKLEAAPISQTQQSWTIPFSAGLGVGVVIGLASASLLLSI